MNTHMHTYTETQKQVNVLYTQHKVIVRGIVFKFGLLYICIYICIHMCMNIYIYMYVIYTYMCVHNDI